MKKQLLLIVAILFLIDVVAKSQSQLGIRNDNFSGINMTLLNPAGHMTSPMNWDLNLIEGYSFVQNNYAYFVNSNVLGLATNDKSFVYGPDNRLRDKPLEGNILEYYEDERDRYGVFHGGVMGPSFFIRLTPNHSVGLITRTRMSSSITGIPNELSFYQFNELLESDRFTLDASNAGVLSWGEIGVNYLYQKETSTGQLGLGITLKYLSGFDGAYVYNETPITLSNLPGDSLRSEPGAVQFAYTNTSVEDSDALKFKNNGSGISADIGLSFAGGQQNNGQYKWKLGVSLLDIGKVSFPDNATFHRIAIDTFAEFGGQEYRTFDGIEETEEALEYFSFQILGDSTASVAGNSFSMWLPTAASIQFDFAVTQKIFVNATIVQGVPLARNGVRRTNLLGLTPRYESRWLSIAVPVSYYNFDQFRLGLSGRLGPLFLGTDNLNSFVSKSDLSGTDFYIGLKINPLLWGGKNKDRRDVGRGSVRCPQF